MHWVRQVAAWAASALPAAAAAALLTAVPAQAATGGGGSCAAYGQAVSYLVGCTAPGSQGSSGAGGTVTTSQPPACTTFALSYWDPALSAELTSSQPPPTGDAYFILVCGDPDAVPGAGTVGNFAISIGPDGAGQATATELARRAWAQIAPPLPVPATAPPRGKDGLVGLAEWFWVPSPAQLVRSVRAGTVSATVTARPVQLTVSPAGLPPLTCQGTGTAYTALLPAADQHTSCSYLFTKPSAGLPGNAYQVTVTITWAATWTGSGGAGGALPDITRSDTFSLPVAQAEALVTTP